MYDSGNIQQYFQICVNVLEARRLAWSNSENPTSYVLVMLGNKKRKTTLRRNQQDPIFGEYLVFEMYMSIREIQRSFLWLSVLEPKFCAAPKIIGEATIDLGTVWAQPNHQVYHKWTQLTRPQGGIGPVGFLKVDISIVYKGEVQIMTSVVATENNLLYATDSEQQSGLYAVSVYAAYCLPTVILAQNERRIGKSPSTYVRVTFSGLMGKTAVQQRSTDPQYSEQISIVDVFPNINQIFRFEISSAESPFNRVIASAELNTRDIAHDGDNGFLPCFGPSLLHMYDGSSGSTAGASAEDGPFHKGALLVALKTVVPYYGQNLRTVEVEPIMPVTTDSLWIQEEFSVYCPVLEMSMLDLSLVKTHTGLAITVAETPSNRPMDEEFYNINNEFKNHKSHYTGRKEVIKSAVSPNGCIDFGQDYPVLQLAVRLPDFRFRMYRNNIIQGIITDLESVIIDVENRLNNYDYNSPIELIEDLNKIEDDTAGNVLKYLDIINYSSNTTGGEDSVPHYSTTLDQKQLTLQREEIEKIYNQISSKPTMGSDKSVLLPNKTSTNGSLLGTRKRVKVLLAESKDLAGKLKSTIFKSPDGWPDLIMWLLNELGSRVAYAKVKLADIVYSVIPEQSGRHCGRIQTIYLKPVKCIKHVASTNCTCIAGKVEVILWLGLFRHRHAFGDFLPADHRLRNREESGLYVRATPMMICCRAYIFRAKLANEGNDALNNLHNTFVRLNALSSSQDTKIKTQTCMPIWNQVLTIQKFICTSVQRMALYPPFVLIEVYDDNLMGKIELLGSYQIQPIFDDKPDYVPKLQWFELYKGTQSTGQILMSVHILPSPERLVRSFLYGCENADSENQISGTKLPMDVDAVESLPMNIIPKFRTYKVDVYWWGLRDVSVAKKPTVVLELDELILKSNAVVDRKPNRNFPNGRISQVFESSFNDQYPPVLSIRLYDSSTFGRTLFLGTKVVKKPSKYTINWIPKHERETTLKTGSVMSTDFCQGGIQMYYVKKCKKYVVGNENKSVYLHDKSEIQENSRKSWWKSIFRNKHTVQPEEKLSLLPIYKKEGNPSKMKKTVAYGPQYDWWMRYYQSSKNLVEENEEREMELPVDSITIYDSELEVQPEFSKFKDWCSSLKLNNGQKSAQDKAMECGLLKIGIAIYKWPPPYNVVAVSTNGVELKRGFFDNHPKNEPSNHIVRIYIVKALNLPKYCTGHVNPYIVLNCGKRVLGDHKDNATRAADPIFGKMYEFACSLPDDYLLTVSVFDYDPTIPDELIGSTKIDLEDRIYTKHRAGIGLAPEYSLTGCNKWRDSQKPSAILEELCAKNHLPLPIYPDPYTVVVNHVEYRDTSENNGTSTHCKEKICLSILRNWHTLPLCGYHLVPEHVETRSLYHPETPGIEKGKLQLWVDIFPIEINTHLPPPRDITPQVMGEYELRVVIWNIQQLNSKRISKDLCVKTFIGSSENSQQMDIQYNSKMRKGKFNPRMVFNFVYNYIEEKMYNKKSPFTEFEESLQPLLTVQVIDDNANESLGTLTLNLNNMPRGAKLPQLCSFEATPPEGTVNLFSMECIRAWWPLKKYDTNTGAESYKGLIDLDLTLLPINKADDKPVELERCLPEPLPQSCQSSKQKAWCSKFTEFISRRGEVLIFFVILSVVWFLVYILRLALPPADYFIAWTKPNMERKAPLTITAVNKVNTDPPIKRVVHQH